jgi:hypothetical protein
MATTLYFLDTPKFLKGILPNDTQFPAFTVVSQGIRQKSSAIPRTLSTTPGIISSTIGGNEFLNNGINATGDSTSYFRLFVSDPVVGGFYVPGPIRLYGTMSQKNITTDVDSFVKVVAYFWRPSTGAIVSGTGVPFTNYQVSTGIVLDPENDGSNDGVPVSGDNIGLGPENGWNVKTGDVFIVEVAARFLSTEGVARKFVYNMVFGGNSQTTGLVITPTDKVGRNGSNPTAFVQLPFDLQFVQASQTPTKPTLFRDMFALVGS